VLSFSGGMACVWVGNYIEKKLRIDDAVGAVAVHGFSGFYGIFLVGIFAGGYPTGVNNIESSFGGQLIGIMTFLPLGFLTGYVSSWVLKKANLLRVPPEVELEGMDMAEFQQDFYPEFERAPEVILGPDGEELEAGPILLDGYAAATNGRVTTRAGT
jgi:ammonium transporter, Amt family